MPNHHPDGSKRSSLPELLADAHRDDMLRAAARSRLAAQAPRVRRRRLRAVLLLALARVIRAPLRRSSARVDDPNGRRSSKDLVPDASHESEVQCLD